MHARGASKAELLDVLLAYLVYVFLGLEPMHALVSSQAGVSNTC
jgi:hypothetical protein